MSPEPFVSRAKAPPAKRNGKGDGDENGNLLKQNGDILRSQAPLSHIGCHYTSGQKYIGAFGFTMETQPHSVSFFYFPPR